MDFCACNPNIGAEWLARRVYVYVVSLHIQKMITCMLSKWLLANTWADFGQIFEVCHLTTFFFTELGLVLVVG